MPQSFTLSQFQKINLIVSSGDASDEKEEITINVENLFSDFLRQYRDCSLGYVDVSGNLSINNGNILVNDNLKIG